MTQLTKTATSLAIGSAVFSNSAPISLIAGPCQLESETHALMIAEKLLKISGRRKIGIVFKSSYDKANRTSAASKRGMGIEAAARIFEKVKAETGFAVLTDVHESWQCAAIAPAVDVLQIPAFLCRQTDLLLAAAATGKVVNIKKGQFLAPWDMKHAVAKITAAGNEKVLVTERGAQFGYNTLVSDMRGLPVLREIGAPVIFDATHSVQQPGGQGATSGGERRMVPVLARAAVAVGVAGLFVETHEDPDHAPSDGPNMVPIDQLESLIEGWQRIDEVAKSILATGSTI